MSTAVDDELWSAIGDPVRRRLVDLLITEGVGTPTSLSERLPISRQAVTKHLLILDRIGVVHATQMGRERRYEINEAQLARAAQQLNDVGRSWAGRLNRIKRMAEEIQRQKDDA
jgi:DNA-binding transcriptional ArsR family regulator